MKKLLATIAVLIAIVSYYTVSYQDPEQGQASLDQEVSVGILQLVSHPSLDEIQQGIQDSFEEDGSQVEINLQNAQGDQNNLNTMSQRFVYQEADLMIGIATPAVQALANASSDIPIIMAGVTDPIEAGLMKDLNQPGRNISGVRDLTPYQDQIDLIQTILPDLSSLGIIYSSGEVNSAKQSQAAKDYAQSLGMEVKEATISSPNDLIQVAAQLCQEVEAIWVGTDNNIASAFPSLVEVANDNQVPIFPAVYEMVASGGLATQGLSQYQIGRLSGQMALEVLAGADIANLPVQDPTETELVVNPDQADRLGLTIPSEILEEADILIEGGQEWT